MKYKADDTIKHFKMRLVMKWYTQTYGIDYIDTFAIVSKINTIQVLLSLAMNLNWPLHKFDMKNIFLHGELSKEVYVDFPLRCIISERHSQKVCNLKKSLHIWVKINFESMVYIGHKVHDNLWQPIEQFGPHFILGKKGRERSQHSLLMWMTW